MNLTNYYWYFQSAIPERICDDIVRYGKSLQDQMAVTGGYGNRPLNKNQIKDLKNFTYDEVIENHIYRTPKGQEIWLKLGLPYVEDESPGKDS